MDASKGSGGAGADQNLSPKRPPAAGAGEDDVSAAAAPAAAGVGRRPFTALRQEEADLQEQEGVLNDDDEEEYARALQDALTLQDVRHEDDAHIRYPQHTWENVDRHGYYHGGGVVVVAGGELVGRESRGLSSDTLASLTSVTYQAQDEEDGNRCAICQKEFEESESLVELPCKHLYCSDCIKKWLQYKKECPLCRAEVSTSDKNEGIEEGNGSDYEEEEGVLHDDEGEEVDEDEYDGERLGQFGRPHDWYHDGGRVVVVARGEVVGRESRGLSSDTLASLTSVTYQAQDEEDGNKEQCAICLTEFEKNESLFALLPCRCEQLYHFHCINEWLQYYKKECPLCRAEVSTSDDNEGIEEGNGSDYEIEQDPGSDYDVTGNDPF